MIIHKTHKLIQNML
jgi:hypothetical protein